jgi:hypothetical protein
MTQTTAPLEYAPDPSPGEVAQMLALNVYEAHRYVPFTVEHASNRVKAWRMGVTDSHFWTDRRAPCGESLNLAKYRPVWTKLMLRCGCPQEAARRLEVALVEREAVRYANQLRMERVMTVANTLDK